MTQFLVDQELKALIALDPPAELLQRVPTAFELEPGLVGMPHGVNEIALLGTMGLEAPSPIEYQYDWPRDKSLVDKPFSHQIITSSFFTRYPRGYCLNDMGTGKTLSTLWAADYLMRLGLVRRVLIAAPLSTLERVWGDALFIHFPFRSFGIVYKSSAKARRKALADKKDFYVINHDGVSILDEDLIQRDDIDLIVLDELTVYRNKGTIKWERMNNVVYPPNRRPRPWVWSLTGAPTPQAPTDAYGQCKLVTPTTVPKYFKQFRNLVMEQQSTYIWTPKPGAIEVVRQAMRPAIRFKRSDCLDLPPIIHQMRDVKMSPEQERLRKEVMKTLRAELDSGVKIKAVNEGNKRSKIVQIAGGVVYDSNGQPQEIDPGNRIDVLMEIIEACDEKVIVFVPYTAMTTMLARELNKHWTFRIVTGDTPVKERNQIFSEFQDRSKRIDLVAHPGCMAHGVALTEAETIIWYAPIDSNEIYMQANDRPTRAGQRFTLNVIHLAGCPEERLMYRRLQTRGRMQGVLLDLIAAEKKGIEG